MKNPVRMRSNLITVIGSGLAATEAEALYLCSSQSLGKEATRPITIHLVEAKEIADLNKKYLRHTGPTDVLSFPLEAIPGVNNSPLGDVFICPEEAESAGEPLLFLVMHSLLHLWGFDHVTDPDAWSSAYAQVKNCLPEPILSTLDPRLREHGFEANQPPNIRHSEAFPNGKAEESRT